MASADDLWRYVWEDEIEIPTEPLSQVLGSGLIGLWRRIFRRGDGEVAPVRGSETLRPLSHHLLGRVAPEPDWQLAVAGLRRAIEPWLDAEEAQAPLLFVVAPPHTHNAAILTHLARKEGWPVLAEPTQEEVLSQETDWLATAAASQSVWVIPALERCYLRHPRGLALVRALFSQGCTAGLGRGIVGCDSWAWAYLKQVAAIPSRALAPQALDQQRLSRWLENLARPGGYRFRRGDSGAYVLPPPEPDSSEEGGPETDTSYLQHLAAYARGNPGVAWAVWRSRLSDSPEEELAQDEGASSLENRSNIWLAPWDAQDRPVLPDGLQVMYTHILHALLLHNGLPATLLAEVLALPEHAVMGALLRLAQAELVEQVADRWQVSAISYPAVRSHLAASDYLCDGF